MNHVTQKHICNLGIAYLIERKTVETWLKKLGRTALQVCDECLQNSYCSVKLGKYLDQLIMILILWRYPVLPLKIHSVIHCKQMLFQEFLLFTS